MTVSRMDRESTALLLVDVQEKLLPVMREPEWTLKGAQITVQAARELGLPVFVTEQYPKGLGKTVPELVEALGEAYRPVEKTAFSAGGALKNAGAKNVLLAGIEAHVCVLQTALDLLDAGYIVFPVADAISSRSAEDRSLGLERMRQSGATLVSTEMMIFELLRDARDPHFKTLQQLIK